MSPSVKIVRGYGAVSDLHRKTVAPSRVDDELWFRQAVTICAEPVAIVVNDKPVFCWDAGGTLELWGQFFVDTQPWPYDEEEGRAFVDSLPIFPTTLQGWTRPIAGVPCEKCEDDVSFLDLSDISSMAAYRSKWSHKRRYNIDRELRTYRGFALKYRSDLSFETFGWLAERSVPAAARQGQRSSFASPVIRASYWNLFVAMEMRGLLRTIEVSDGEKLVGVVVLSGDPVEKMNTLHVSFSDAAYPSLGKLLYELLIEQSIVEERRGIWGGYGLFDIKKVFGFTGVPIWDLRVEDGNNDDGGTDHGQGGRP